METRQGFTVGDETASPSAEHAADKGLDVGSEVAASSPEASAGDLPAAASKSLEAATTAAAESEDGQAIALVVDSEVTSYLMMGALSPGLKRHSVTLFEGIFEHSSTLSWPDHLQIPEQL